jgi:hypothetical protein
MVRNNDFRKYRKKTGMDGGDVLYPDVLWKSVDMGDAP